MTETGNSSALLERLLEELQCGGGVAPPPRQRLTRRQFLGGTGSASLLLAAGTGKAPPTIKFQPSPVIVVEFDGSTWSIDPRLFGQRARASFRRQGSGWVIELTKATLPGTDLRVDFRALIEEGIFGEWQIVLELPRLHFKEAGALGAWIAGRKPISGAIRLREFRAGGSRVTFQNAGPILSLSPGFGYQISGVGLKVSLEALGSTGGSLRLDVQPSSPGSLLACLPGAETDGPTTLFSVANPGMPSAALCLGRTEGAVVWYEPGRTSGLRGELFDKKRGRRGGVVQVEGQGRVVLGDCTQHGGAAGRRSPRLYLEKAVFAKTIDEGCEKSVALCGNVTSKPRMLNVDGWSAAVQGDATRPLAIASHDEELTVFRVDALLSRISLPVIDADRAGLRVLPDRWVRIALPNEEKGDSIRLGTRIELPDALQTGHESVTMVRLDDTELDVQRGTDALSLGFAFQGFDLRLRGRESCLERACGQPKDGRALSILFPPQHIAEQFIDSAEPRACCDGPTFDVSPARLSGRSRLVFRLEDADGTDHVLVGKPLSVEALTDWNELGLRVNARALEPEVVLAEQLELVHIEPATTLVDAIEAIEESLQPPGPFETALELSGRLILSPDRRARWMTPAKPASRLAVGAGRLRTVLWHARLREESRAGVRAIWSAEMRPGHFNIKALGPCESKAGMNRMLVLSPSDHWQIVAQSSVYGIPALRRIASPDAKDGYSVEATKQPRSRVVRPASASEKYDGTYRYLSELDRCFPGDNEGNPLPDSGIATPTPFNDANVILTPWGGSLVALWEGEPPLVRYPKDCGVPREKWPMGFSLEHLAYWSQVGRDIRIEVFKKGYYLPNGYRVSYVELTERRFFRHRTLGHTIAVPVRRTFNICKKAEKRFPAVNQPYGSRDFPVSSTEMLTMTTPDLVNPIADKSVARPTIDPNFDEKPDGGQLLFKEGLDQNDCIDHELVSRDALIFWPRFRPRGDANSNDCVEAGAPADVDFKWRVDGDDAVVHSNLLFVENTALADRDLMKAVVKYYQKLAASTALPQLVPEAARCIARLGGARRRYAQRTGTRPAATAKTARLLLTRRSGSSPREGERRLTGPPSRTRWTP